jgi:thiamine pyrophosphate-dependent acetolactate synthase large subunit-like protein
VAVQSLGERIAELLVAEGVDKLFSLPEVTFGKLHDALDRRGVPLIAPHHEAAAAYMAEAYSQLTGQIGVVGGSVGPGTINLYSAIANSHSENLPILYLGSERTLRARSSPRSSQFQCPPNSEVLKPITKYATVVEEAQQIDDVFQEAFRQLRTGTPGPVYIGLPFDMLLEEHEFGPLTPPRRYRPATFVSTVADSDIEQAAATLAAARLPLLIVGAGARNSRAQRAFNELVETLGCPVIQTFGARGMLPDNHPQLFDLSIEPGASLCRQADAILVIGSAIGERLGFGGHAYSADQQGFPNYFGAPGSQTWLQLDRDPAVVGRNRPVDHALIGDIPLTLPRLTAALRGRRAATPELPVWQQQRADYYRELHASTADTRPIHPGRAIDELQKSLPDDAVVVRDGGAFSVWEMNLLHHPISEHISAGKQGMLGTGVSYGIGAALATARDGRRVCVITGDGAFGFFAMELETAVRYQLPIVIVIGYDAGWSLEVPYYMHVCGRTFEVDHNFMRLDELARTVGAHGEFCETTDQIAPAVARAFAAGKPAVVQIVIDRQVNAYEMPNNHLWTRWHADKSVYQS